MKHTKTLCCAFLLFSGFLVTGMSQPIRHRFVAIDEGKGNLLHINEFNPQSNWIRRLNVSASRDLQLIGNNRILVGHGSGYIECDLATGDVVQSVTRFNGTTAVCRLENGNTLVTGLNLEGRSGVIVLEVDSAESVVREMVFPGNYVRLMRRTAVNTYLFCRDTEVYEGDSTGTYLWDFGVDGFSHCWKAVRLANGNTLASAGYGAFMVEVDPQKNIVRKFGQAAQVPPAVNPYFYAMFQLLGRGSVVVANWQGHGDGHGNSGVQLLEFDSSGQIIWQWSDAGIISSLQGVLVIDSLNTALLHDERQGAVAPVVRDTVPDDPVSRRDLVPHREHAMPRPGLYRGELRFTHPFSNGSQVEVFDPAGRLLVSRTIKSTAYTEGITLPAAVCGMVVVRVRHGRQCSVFRLWTGH